MERTAVVVGAAAVSAAVWFGLLNWWLFDPSAPVYAPALSLVALVVVTTAVVAAARRTGAVVAFLAAALPFGTLGAHAIWSSDPLGPIGATVWTLLVLAATLVPALAVTLRNGASNPS